ncbi:MAG: TonB-dependent receptor, partial [Pseudomonadota bacterium]
MNGQTSLKTTTCIVALAFGLAPLSGALAQSTETPATGDELVGEDIVIYGTKVEGNFLETPTSVGIITSEQIEDNVIKDTFEGFNLLANVRRLNPSGGFDSFQIRGLSADGIAGIANPANTIALVIDGASQNSEGLRRGARSTWDLEQIEVLRGPQSGLYGRAALGGAVILKSKDPTFDYEGAVRVSFGSNENFGASIMASGPLIEDQVALRISADVQSESTDITINDPLNAFFAEDDFHNIRAKLLIEPDALPGFSALFTVNNAYDQTASPTVSQPFSDRVFNDGGLLSEVREATINNYIADLSYQLTDDLTVRSLTTYVDTDLTIQGVQGSTVYSRDDLRDGSDIAQELVLEIEDVSGHGLTGLIGAYYGVIETENTTDIRADAGAILFGFPTGLDPIQQGSSSTETTSMALYADLKYNFFGPFSVIGGLRYQKDEVRSISDVSGIDLNTFTPFTSQFDVESEFDVFLPRAGLMYEINDSQTVSAIASRGYRAGYVESVAGTVPGTRVQNNIDPEFVWTYELAYRYQDEDGLSFGANAFFNDYSDQQLVETDPVSFQTFTRNAGSSQSYGFELEGRYAMDNGLSIFGALGYLKTEIDSLPAGTCNAPNTTCAGNEFPEAPDVTAAIGGSYKHPEGFFASADVNYTGSYFTNGDISNT